MEWYATIALGITLLAFGLFFFRRHQLAIIRFRNDNELRDKQKSFLIAQQKRRLFTTCLIIFLGPLIPALLYSIDTLKNPILATVLLILILVIIVVICLLAVTDMFSNRYLRNDLDLARAESELKRRILEQELERHQTSKTSTTSQPDQNGYS